MHANVFAVCGEELHQERVDVDSLGVVVVDAWIDGAVAEPDTAANPH